MVALTISDKLLKINNKLRLGVVFADVKVEKSSQKLDELIKEEVLKVQMKLKGVDDLSSVNEIKAVRDTYKKLELKTSAFLGSNEALLKRVKQGKELYKINNVVDINNLVSIQCRRSIGSYDLDKLQGDIQFRAGLENEEYTGTTKRSMSLKNLPVLVDSKCPFGSPTSDSKRALIVNETKKFMMVVFSFDGENNLSEQLEEISKLLICYANAQNVQKHILSDGKVILPNLAIEEKNNTTVVKESLTTNTTTDTFKPSFFSEGEDKNNEKISLKKGI